MTNEDKKQKKIQRAKNRGEKNVKRNHKRWERNGSGGGMDCPYDVDMNGQYGTCTCGGENYEDRKSTRLNSSHRCISYAVFCLKKKKKQQAESTDVANEMKPSKGNVQ